MSGKYGYYDPEGVLREATYGASSDKGFHPQIEGVVLPPIREEKHKTQQRSFKKETAQSLTGRKTLVRKRVRARSRQLYVPQMREQPLNKRPSRDESLRRLERERAALLETQLTEARVAPAPTFNPFLRDLDLLTGSYTITY